MPSAGAPGTPAFQKIFHIFMGGMSVSPLSRAIVSGSLINFLAGGINLAALAVSAVVAVLPGVRWELILQRKLAKLWGTNED